MDHIAHLKIWNTIVKSTEWSKIKLIIKLPIVKMFDKRIKINFPKWYVIGKLFLKAIVFPLKYLK
jgi:hypothetical protein